jgi:hypothetical protein
VEQQGDGISTVGEIAVTVRIAHESIAQCHKRTEPAVTVAE